jgi:4-alpha-glucanotransferase
LGSEARMNIPSSENGNWRWRFAPELLRPEVAKKLATLAEVCDRLPRPLTLTSNEEWAV